MSMAVVRAHQAGYGIGAYRRQQRENLTVAIDRQYTLRGERRRARSGREVIVWHACADGREIGEIMPSAYQSDVAAELRQYINDGGASRMTDLPNLPKGKEDDSL